MEAIVVFTARALGKAADLTLGDEGSVWAHPRLRGVQVLESVLLLVLPLHMALLVEDRVPPYVKKTVGPGGAPHEERAKIEAGAVLRDEHVDG